MEKEKMELIFFKRHMLLSHKATVDDSSHVNMQVLLR